MADEILAHVDELASGKPISPACAKWLAEGFKRHLQGEPLTAALGMNAPGHGGLVHAVLRRRWRAELARAIATLDGPGVKSFSIARILAAEFDRQERSRRPPTTALERAIYAARQTYQAPATTEKALWVEVEKLRGNSQ